jgi:uncharacterized protein
VENTFLVEQKPTPWGFWATVGFSCCISLAYVLITIPIVVVAIIVAHNHDPKFDMRQFTETIESNDLFLSIATCLTAPAVIGLAIFFAKLRKNITVKEYLCLRRVRFRELIKWCLLVLLLAAGSDTISYFLHQPIVPEFMINAYKNAYFVPLLLAVLIIIAPLSEEIFFRGFLFKGIEYSKLGAAGAIILTSLTWAVIHTQYDVYGVTNIFIGGLLLGIARFKTQSIYLPITMHALMNLVATAELLIYLALKGG